MDLHLSSITKPAQELFELLKDYKFRLKVFDFSINEMVRVVKGYLSERHKYFPHIKVDSIYSNLKNKGWTREDCIGFISNIEQKIYALGIQIENTGIDLNKWEIPKDDIYLRISQYKPDQHPLGQKHDICAIEKIKEIRKRPQRNIEDCIALFLTSDRKLAKFNLVESGHRENFTVCEVILDKLFTVLLWFKNPQAVKELPLTIVLSTQFEILISKDIWNRFFNTVMSLRKENEISEDGISMLVYHNNITEDLILIKDPREINEEFILNKIKERKKEMDENRERMIEEGKKEIEEKYTTEMQKKDEEYLAKIERIKANLKEEVKKKARIVSNLLFAIIPILFLILCCWLSKRGLLTSQSSIFALVGFFVNIFGIKIDIFKCRKKIQDSFLNRNYEKMLEKLDIKEF